MARVASANASRCPWKQFSELAGEASCNPEEGAALTALEPTFSTKDAAGPILVTVLGMVAEMERKFIRERQRACCRDPIVVKRSASGQTSSI